MTKSRQPKAFKNTVITGLQLFLTLGLDGRPAQDSIAATAEVWCDLLSPLREWDDEDIANLQAAFKTTARQVSQWPQPSHVINNLAPKVRITQALPTPPITDEQRAKIDGTVASLLARMQVKPVQTRLPKNVNIARITSDE